MGETRYWRCDNAKCDEHGTVFSESEVHNEDYECVHCGEPLSLVACVPLADWEAAQRLVQALGDDGLAVVRGFTSQDYRAALRKRMEGKT